jgi:hypothetical protein
MAGKSLSHLSDIATQKTNVAGVTTPILEVQPDNGTLLKLLNYVSTGAAEGLPLIGKFRDSNGNEFPTDTTVIFEVERPTDDEATAVSVAEDNIAAWNGLSTQEQRNEENIDSVKVELQGSAVNIRDKDVLTVEVDSSAQIDWSQSELYFMREAVREEAYDG